MDKTARNKYCENCGCKVFSLGCVNCDEDNYIEEQRWENDRLDRLYPSPPASTNNQNGGYKE